MYERTICYPMIQQGITSVFRVDKFLKSNIITRFNQLNNNTLQKHNGSFVEHNIWVIDLNMS